MAGTASTNPTQLDTKRIARAFGIWFLLTWVFAIAARSLFDPAYNDPDFLLGAGSDFRVQLGAVLQIQSLAYLAGGLVFGLALYRAGVLARWAAALLAVGGVITVVLSLMPDAFYRLLAFPNGIAMIGLGYSLWRERRTSDEPLPSLSTPRREPTGVVEVPDMEPTTGRA